MSSNQKDMLIDHKVITVTPSEPEQEFMDALQDGYDILNSTALPDGSITYVLRKRLRDGAYNNAVKITDPFAYEADPEIVVPEPLIERMR